MNMEIMDHPRLKETVHRIQLGSGLEVLVIPKPEFSEKYGALSTRFGSVDNRFRLSSEEQEQSIPDGMAHFLEHTLFEKKDGNISERFSERGAYHNAYTSHISTAYHFSCSRRFEENLHTLMELVFCPYFTEAMVNKEKGIINQEISMYDDLPQWQVYQNLLAGLYHQHPVRINIAGSHQAIAGITPEILTNCHRLFYQPQNMVLAAAGDIDPEKTAKTAENWLKEHGIKQRLQIQRIYPKEPSSILRREVKATLPVPRPLVLIGFKESDPPANGEEMIKREVMYDLVLEGLFGKGSDFFEDLYTRGIISAPVDTEYSGYFHYGLAMVGTETDDPGAFIDQVEKTLSKAKQEGLPVDVFKAAKRKFLGGFILAHDHLDRLAQAHISAYHRDGLFFDYERCLDNMTVEAIDEWITTCFLEEQKALSIVEPVKAKRK